MKFNKPNLQGLEVKKSKYIVMDDALEYFGLRIYPSNKKTFIVRIRQDSKQKMYTVGDYPALSVPDARKIAQELILKYQAGVDIKAVEKIEKVKSKTFLSCIEDYLPSVKPTTQKDISMCMKMGWETWLEKPIRNITALKVLKIYDTRKKDAPNRARLEMAYLRSIWNFHKKNLNLDNSPTIIAKCQGTCRIFLLLTPWGLCPQTPRIFLQR